MSRPGQFTAEHARAATALRVARRLEGLAYARAWRERTKPYFDALYGGTNASD